MAIFRITANGAHQLIAQLDTEYGSLNSMNQEQIYRDNKSKDGTENCNS